MQALLMPLINAFLSGFLNQSETIPANPMREARELRRLEAFLKSLETMLVQITERVQKRRKNLETVREDNTNLRNDIRDIIKNNLEE